MKDDPSTSGTDRPWLRFVGLGMELAAFTLVLTGIGYWIDSARQHETPYASAAGALIGFVLGMTRFVIQATRKSDDP